MKRKSKEKRPKGGLPPVERIELNEEHAGRRLVLVIVLLVLGCTMLGYALMTFLSPETGWQPVEVSASAGLTSGEEFTFLYDSSSTAEAKGVNRLYTELCLRAYQLFESSQSFEGVTNVYTINRSPNQVLEVDGALYDALAQFADSGRRELYLGPVYSRYNDLFFCQHDAQLVDFDPRLSQDVAREYGEILDFANDPQAIGLELLGENQVRLRVSQAYLDFAQEKGIRKFIDFGWMRNAFIIDFLARELTAGGYTHGVLSSYDGFTRNLDGRGTDYSYPLHQRREEGVYQTAVLHYQGPMALVCLRDYATSEQDLQRYYTLSSGEVRTVYLDTADALCKSAVSSLVCYAPDKGCAEILLEMIPAYIADAFQRSELVRLEEAGVWSVTSENRELLHSDPAAELADVYSGYTPVYAGS